MCCLLLERCELILRGILEDSMHQATIFLILLCLPTHSFFCTHCIYTHDGDGNLLRLDFIRNVRTTAEMRLEYFLDFYYNNIMKRAALLYHFAELHPRPSPVLLVIFLWLGRVPTCHG